MTPGNLSGQRIVFNLFPSIAGLGILDLTMQDRVHLKISSRETGWSRAPT